MNRPLRLLLALVLISLLAVGVFGCSQNVVQDPDTRVVVLDQNWAISKVNAYLNGLASSPNAIRYLADLSSQTWVEAIYLESAVGQDVLGHPYSGWQVYFRPTGGPPISRTYWGNLNWAVARDGFVSEGSNDALRVKADLLELK
ncbi:hypothetical protein Dform_00521 [Dehalogenimonas formicexedens]|uniref:Lipoprotein n=1 Tax=Dehalogenimonas formicexedens TaxID=1839801 RepID=A0A1P8F5W3_9CHLR|nr:hypothetical protein Dform_00521 [Dehalogenimonas formicexedens]